MWVCNHLLRLLITCSCIDWRTYLVYSGIQSTFDSAVQSTSVANARLDFKRLFAAVWFRVFSCLHSILDYFEVIIARAHCRVRTCV